MSESRPEKPSPEEEILALEQREAEAELKSDVAALGMLWSDDLLMNSTAKVIAGKQLLLELFQSGRIKMHTFERRTLKSAVVGELVVTTGNETSEVSPSPNGTATRLFCSYMNVWIRQQGGWKLLARHVGLIGSSGAQS